MGVFSFGLSAGITRTWSGTFTTEEPLAHWSGDRQPAPQPTYPFRRMAVIHGGQRHLVPFVSGNSIRGILRRLVGGDLLNRVGLAAENVGPRVLYLLTAGGGLEATEAKRSKSRGEAKPEDETEPAPPQPVLYIGSPEHLRQMLVPLVLFGASYGPRLLEGSLRVGHALALCSETAPVLGLASDIHLGDLTAWAVQSRRAEHLPKADGNDTDSTQRPIVFRYEYLVPGVTLAHSMAVEAASELEVSCLAHAMDLLRQRPFLGGRWASGHGRVRIEYEPIGDPNPYLAWGSKRTEPRYATISWPWNRREPPGRDEPHGTGEPA